MRRSEPQSLRIAITCLLLALLCLSLVGCSGSATGKALNVGVVVTKLIDQRSTDAAEARGAVEANFILGSQQWRQVVIGAMGVSGVIALAGLVETRDRRVLSHVLRVIPMIVWGAAAMHNGRIAR